MKKFKIIVPKPMMDAEANLVATEADQIIDASDEAMEAELNRFVENGWAMETKAEEPDETTAPVDAEVAPKKAPAKKKAAAAKEEKRKRK